MSEAMEVYHAQTPVRSMNQSIALFKSHQRAVYDELCKTKPKTFTSFGSNYAKTYTQVSYPRLTPVELWRDTLLER